jgi:hypothetical protein
MGALSMMPQRILQIMIDHMPKNKTLSTGKFPWTEWCDAYRYDLDEFVDHLQSYASWIPNIMALNLIELYEPTIKKEQLTT